MPVGPISEEDKKAVTEEERDVWAQIQTLADQAVTLARNRDAHTIEFAAFDVATLASELSTK